MPLRSQPLRAHAQIFFRVRQGHFFQTAIKGFKSRASAGRRASECRAERVRRIRELADRFLMQRSAVASNGVRRFRQEIDGEVWVGLVWRSEREMELWLCDRGFPVSEALALSDADEESPRARGRPSMDALIGAAVATLRDRLTGSRSDRARTVLQELAKHASEDMLPSLKTITRYLATLEGQKSGQKSTDDKPTTDGGAQCLRKSGAK